MKLAGQNTSKPNNQATTLVAQPQHHSGASTTADSAASMLDDFPNFFDSSTIAAENPLGETSASLSAGDDSVGDNLKALEDMYPEDIDDFNDLLEIDPVELMEPPLGPTLSHHDPDNSEQAIKDLVMWLKDTSRKAYKWVEAFVRDAGENEDSELENLLYANSQNIATDQLSITDSAALIPSAWHCSNPSGFNPGPSYPGPGYGHNGYNYSQTHAMSVLPSCSSSSQGSFALYPLRPGPTVPIDKPNWSVPSSNCPNQTSSNTLPSYGQVRTFDPLNNSAAGLLTTSVDGWPSYFDTSAFNPGPSYPGLGYGHNGYNYSQTHAMSVLPSCSSSSQGSFALCPLRPGPTVPINNPNWPVPSRNCPNQTGSNTLPSYGQVRTFDPLNNSAAGLLTTSVDGWPSYFDTSAFNPGPSYPEPGYGHNGYNYSQTHAMSVLRFGGSSSQGSFPLCPPRSGSPIVIDNSNWPVSSSNYTNQTSSNILPRYGQVPTFGPLNNSAASCSTETITISDSDSEPESDAEPELLAGFKEPYPYRNKDKKSLIEDYFVIDGTCQSNVFALIALGWKQPNCLIGPRSQLLPKKLDLADAKRWYKEAKSHKLDIDAKRKELEQLNKDKTGPLKERDEDGYLQIGGDGYREKYNRYHVNKADQTRRYIRALNSLNLSRVYLQLKAKAELFKKHAESLHIILDTTSSESRTYSHKFEPEANITPKRTVAVDTYERAIAVDAYIRETTTEFEKFDDLLSAGLDRMKDCAKRLVGKSCENPEEVPQILQRVSDPIFDALASGDTKKLEASRTKVSEVIEALPDATDQQSPFEPYRQRVEKLYSDCSEVDVKFSNEGFRSLLKEEEAACNETTTASAPPLGRLAGSAFFQQPPPTKARRIETQTVTSNPTWSADLTF